MTLNNSFILLITDLIFRFREMPRANSTIAKCTLSTSPSWLQTELASPTQTGQLRSASMAGNMARMRFHMTQLPPRTIGSAKMTICPRSVSRSSSSAPYAVAFYSAGSPIVMAEFPRLSAATRSDLLRVRWEGTKQHLFSTKLLHKGANLWMFSQSTTHVCTYLINWNGF